MFFPVTNKPHNNTVKIVLIQKNSGTRHQILELFGQKSFFSQIIAKKIQDETFFLLYSVKIQSGTKIISQRIQINFLTSISMPNQADSLKTTFKNFIFTFLSNFQLEIWQEFISVKYWLKMIENNIYYTISTLFPGQYALKISKRKCKDEIASGVAHVPGT